MAIPINPLQRPYSSKACDKPGRIATEIRTAAAAKNLYDRCIGIEREPGYFCDGAKAP